MEVYILDSLLRRNQVVDKFESFIWTERFSAWGDFELKLHSTFENRSRFSIGDRLAMNESYRVMTVETIEDTTDDEGRAVLTVKGRSLEAILEGRLARGVLSNLTDDPKWILTGTPGAIARQMFHDICVTGVLTTRDIIPFVIEDSIFPEDTISESTETITYEIDPMSLYKAEKDLCDSYGLGFRLVRNFDTSQLYWDVYSGSDRTSSQTTLPAVIFSPNLDNLRNTSELTTIESYKNVAYIITPHFSTIIYPDGVDPNITTGFDRFALIIKADDITDTLSVDALPKMTQRAKEELAKNRRFSAFDGELSLSSQYKYGVDYNVGDLIEMQNVDGVINKMQVTEQIFVSDREGERSYPTLSVNTFITEGSWLSWDFNQEWDDLGAEEWDDEP